jgi:hypothetical protein
MWRICGGSVEDLNNLGIEQVSMWSRCGVVKKCFVEDVEDVELLF